MNIFAHIKRWLKPGLTCEQVNHFLVEYFDNALPGKVKAEFEAHISACPPCRTYMEQYRKTIELVKASDSVPEPPAELIEETLHFLQQHMKR